MAHTLTLTGNAYITVNGTQVTPPYELQDGDVISISARGSNKYININDASYIEQGTFTIDIENMDLEVSTNGNVSGPFWVTVVVNYTEPQTTTQNIKIGTSNVDIKIGETQVDKVYVGTILVWEKEEPTPQGETWVIKDNPQVVPSSRGGQYHFEGGNFTSNGQTFSYIEITPWVSPPPPVDAQLYFETTSVYGNAWWPNPAYKTITFETSPTGDLLTWLQANAVKQ